jgi:hypothetical protein
MRRRSIRSSFKFVAPTSAARHGEGRLGKSICASDVTCPGVVTASTSGLITLPLFSHFASSSSSGLVECLAQYTML